MKRLTLYENMSKLLCVTIFCFAFANAEAYNVTVAKDGSGNFLTVQAAIDAAAGYNFTDNFKLTTKTFYLLKMVDRDRNFTYSRIISLNVNRGSLSVFPNPATDRLTVVHLKSGNGIIKIFTADGKQVLEQKVNADTSQTEIKINSF